MSKRKSLFPDEEQEPLEAPAEALDENLPTSPAESGEELIDGQWQAGQWHQIPMLTCVHCQWATLEGVEHAREHRLHCSRCRPESPPATGLLVSDRGGRIVETR